MFCLHVFLFAWSLCRSKEDTGFSEWISSSFLPSSPLLWKVSLCSPGWTPSVDKANLELRDPLDFASVLGLKAYATRPIILVKVIKTNREKTKNKTQQKEEGLLEAM